MSLFDRLIATTLPLVPKPLVRVIANRYIAGETKEDAVRIIKELNSEGARATVDVLGEDTLEPEQARATVEEYTRFLDAIVEHELDCNISIKLTAMGLLFDDQLCRDGVRHLLELARERGLFVRIDMEDSSVTGRTLDLYRELRRENDNVGPVLQAYMRRSENDVRELLAGEPLNVRLCKGIYNEPEEVAFKDRDVIRRSYSDLLEQLLRGGAYVGIATHDEPLLRHALRLVEELELKSDQYEFQMLLGVIPERRKRIIAEGHPLRVYVPYGINWYGYSVRRLRENPKVAGYVMKSILTGR